MKKQKNKTNYGEKFVEAMTKSIEDGRYDACIKEDHIEYLDCTKLYKYIFNKPSHIANGLTAIADVGFEYTAYMVRHPLLQDYIINYDVAMNLFYAMREAHNREKQRMSDLNEKKIIEFLENNGTTTQGG